MFFNQCNTCNERWEAGTASTCKCLPLPDYRFNMEDAPVKYQLGKAISTDWVMRITPDRKIEVAEDVEVTEAAKKVLEAMQGLINSWSMPLTDEQIKLIWRDIDGSEGMLIRFARAIEAKLREKNT